MEEALPGGNMNDVIRAGNTVRRPAGPWTATVHKVLDGLRRAGIEWVPRPHGIDEAGREILDYVEGVVPSYPLPEWVWEDSFLEAAGGRLREFHDATADLTMVDPVWQVSGHEPVEVICHNDFAPYNFVCRDGRFAGVIDWDAMSPGPRIWDVAYLAYRLCPLAAPTNPDGLPGDNPSEQGRRLGLLLSSYRGEFTAADTLSMAVARLEDLARFTADRAESEGRPDLAGHVSLYRNDIGYLNAVGQSILSSRAGADA